MRLLYPSQRGQCRRLYARAGMTPTAIARLTGYNVAAVRHALGIQTSARRRDGEADGNERLEREKARLLALLPAGMAAEKWREVVEANF